MLNNSTVLTPLSHAIAAIRAHDPDNLIVVGTHGRTGLKHALLGSVAERRVGRCDGCPSTYDEELFAQVMDTVRISALQDQCHTIADVPIVGDAREVIADLNPVLMGWGNYFRTGNASAKFNQLDCYVYRRLMRLLVRRGGERRWRVC